MVASGPLVVSNETCYCYHRIAKSEQLLQRANGILPISECVVPRATYRGMITQKKSIRKFQTFDSEVGRYINTRNVPKNLERWSGLELGITGESTRVSYVPWQCGRLSGYVHNYGPESKSMERSTWPLSRVSEIHLATGMLPSG
jgi:hypothetical protein